MLEEVHVPVQASHEGRDQAGTGKYHGPTSRVWKDTMDLLLESGKNTETTSRVRKDTMDLLLEYRSIPWTSFESTERYHGPTSRVQKDTMGLLLEYGKIRGEFKNKCDSSNISVQRRLAKKLHNI
jgi:hypothetical protein